MSQQLFSLYDKPNQIITLDANFLIPPDRQSLSIMGIPFSNLAIPEAVYAELVLIPIKSFIQAKLVAIPPQIIIHKDSELTRIEQMLRDSIEAKIYTFTRYEPQLNNHEDRG